MVDDAIDETDDDGMVVENGSGASVVLVEMDSMKETDDLFARGGPKSRKRKTPSSRAAKKIKLGNVNIITNYFHLDGEKSRGI